MMKEVFVIRDIKGCYFDGSSSFKSFDFAAFYGTYQECTDIIELDMAKGAYYIDRLFIKL